MTSTDTAIYPTATGAAATYAADHSAPAGLTLYCGWFCPFAQRAWMMLHEKNITHRYVETNPYKKEPAFVALNPRGLVPTVVIEDHGGSSGGGGNGARRKSDGTTSLLSSPRVVYESTVVCEFLDEAFADERTHGGPLLTPPGGGPYERARARIWIDHVNRKVVPAFYRLLQHTPAKPYSLDEARAELLAHLETFVREMMDQQQQEQQQGPWFFGSIFSMVDLMLAPWAARLFLIDHYKQGGVGIPTGPDAGKVWNRWQIWYEAVLERPSLVDTLSDRDKYIDVYKRYADDTTQSLVGQATRSGRHLP